MRTQKVTSDSQSVSHGFQKTNLKMKRKHLESALSQLQREFPEPDITLEQYPTNPSLAASVALAALEDLGPSKTALDLGCGTGMLAAACALMGTDMVWGIDCDEAALAVAAENMEDMELDVEFVAARVKGVEKTEPSKAKASRKGRYNKNQKGSSRQRHQNSHQAATRLPSDFNYDDGIPLSEGCVDTVLTNPPFGTKNNAGMDMKFLHTACRLAKQAVYSFHKTSTRDFILQQAKEWKRVQSVEVVAELKFELPQVYKFHKEKSVDIDVDLIRCMIAEEKE